MNANELISTIREAGASSDYEVLATLNNNSAMGYIFGLPDYDPSDAKIVSTHYKAMQVVKTAYQMVKGDTK